MIITGGTTAILFFALTPDVQAQEKEWKGVSKSLNRKTQARLFHHTSEIIKQSGLPCIISDENTQKGHDFGTKLSNAIEDVFSQGYCSVIVLGNDCPQLSSSILESAIQQLTQNKSVIGPSQSGVYLMGIQKNTFDKTAFEHLPWQTRSLQNSLLEYFNKNSEESILLPFLADLNCYQDLSLFTGLKTISSRLMLVFQALIQCLRHPSYDINELTLSFLFAAPKSHRGPPKCV